MSKTVPEDYCPNCGHRLNRTSVPGPDDPVPQAGDVTVCLYCSHLMVFAEDMSLRAPNDAELIELAGRPDILRVMQFVREFQEKFG